MNEASSLKKLRVAALQLPLVWGHKDAAFALLEAQLAALSGVQLVLLPEAFFTGYVSPMGRFDLRPYAEPLDGESRQRVAALARRFNVAIAAPLIEQAGQQYFNSMLFIDEHGALLGHYRKRHPWFPEKWASPGDLGFPVFLWGGCSLCMAICFDLHFLGKERGRELTQADLLLFSSVWVEEDGDTRTPQLQGLAQRYKVNVINANWAESLPRVPSQGGSVIFDASGGTLARAAGASPQAVISDLDLPNKNPVA
jgi:5-aminopentanamidase